MPPMLMPGGMDIDPGIGVPKLSISPGAECSPRAAPLPGTLMMESSMSWAFVALGLSIEADWSIISDISYRLLFSVSLSMPDIEF